MGKRETKKPMQKKYKQLIILIFMLCGILSRALYAQELTAGAFLPGESLGMTSRIQARSEENIDFMKQAVADLDLDGVPDSIVADDALKIVWGSDETEKDKRITRLSDSNGSFAVYDMNADGAADLLQEQGLGQIVLYENITMPALQLEEDITLPEDSVYRISYSYETDEKDSVAFFPSVNISEISLYPDSSGLTLISLRNWSGSAVLTIAYGHEKLMDTVQAQIHVLPVNDPPVKLSAPPVKRIREDTQLILYKDSLLSRFRDPDPEDELYIREHGDRKEIRDRDSLFIYRPEENWYGKDSLYFLVSDGEFHDTLCQPVIVEAVNDAPKWDTPDTLKLLEDELLRLPYSWLYEHSKDIETPDTLLRFQAFPGSHVSISLEGGMITILPEKDWYGTDTLLLTVSDGELSNTAYWHVEVEAVNDPPVLYELPEIAFNEDDTLYIGLPALQRFAEDVEMPRKNLKWQARRLGKIRAFYDGSRIRLTAPQDWYGTDSIRLTVSDGELTASRNWVIHIRPVNDPPRWRRMPDRSFLEDDTLRISRRELYRYASDPETPDEELIWKLIPSDDLHIRETEMAYYIFAEPEWYGNAHIRMIISDGEYADTVGCRIRVISVNDPPQIEDIPGQTWAEDDTLTLSRQYLEQFASDVETKASELLWRFLAKPPLFVREENAVVKFYAAADWNGEGNISIVVDDGGLQDTSIMKVNITSVNDAPRWQALPDTHIMEDKSLMLPLSFIRQFVYDPDEGDALIIGYRSSDNVYIEEKPDTIILWPEPDWYGKEELLLTAGDGKETVKKTWTIPVLPVNDPPYFTMALPDSLSFKSNSSDTLIFEDIVYDIDNELNDLVWEITPGRIVRYMINDDIGGAVFYTENNKSGEDAITIRVTDGHDMIVYYMPVYVHEVDRFLTANPEKLELFPNSPNPFTEYTNIRYSLPASCHVTIRIYDLLGKEIKELANGYHEASNHSVRWYGENESGMPAPSGVYLCRMVAMIEGDPVILMRKMMLVR
ncbi:MAG: tandem-95 repeat protein [Candidatus Marinimicrobia bacterium]|nr:tandem-95 repeat protein [Candidatus Neomarinimicrobiota bacterium]